MNFIAMLRLELLRLRVRPFGWVLLALGIGWLGWNFTLLVGSFLASQVQRAGLPDSPGYVDLVAVPLLGALAQLAFLVVPLLGMATLAGERRNGTLAVLLASGVPASRIVLGKYAALVLWLLVWLALTLAMPLSLAHATSPDWGKLASATLGLFLMLASLAAIAVAASAFTSHPALAAVVGLLVGLGLWTLNLGAQRAGIDDGAINAIAMSTHVQNLLRGLVSSADLLWFVLVIAVCLALATRRIATDRERG